MTFYGVCLTHWSVNFGSFSNHHYILTEEYLSDACGSSPSSQATLDTPINFIFPQHLKKTYFIEGVANGQITYACNGNNGYIHAYRVSICKVNEDTTEEELYSTGWITVEKDLNWDSVYEVGEEIVFPFWIDCWEHKKLGEGDRIYIKIETNTTGNSHTYLCHSNDANWEDFKINIPFRW